MTINTPKMPNPKQPDLIGFASTYTSGTRIDRHSHDAHQLIHAISGAMRVLALNRLWVLPVGRALWVPAHVQHDIQCNGAVGMRTVYLSQSYTSLPPNVRVVAVSPLAREVLVRLAEGADAALHTHLGHVLIHEIQHSKVEAFSLPLPKDARIATLASDLRADPASQVTLAEWSKKLGTSERSLMRYIQDETGMTFRELRRQTRIMVAIEKLVEGHSVTNVAFDVGFETTSAFINAFRLVVGKTPGQFSA